MIVKDQTVDVIKKEMESDANEILESLSVYKKSAEEANNKRSWIRAATLMVIAALIIALAYAHNEYAKHSEDIIQTSGVPMKHKM